MEGLPGKENDLTISLVVNNGVLFMSLKDSPNTETHPNGLWQFDEEQWWHLADPPVQYGLGKLMVVSGHLYGVSHNILYRFDINRRFWYDTMKFLPDFSNFYQGDGKVLLHKGGTTDPQLSMLTLDAAGQGTWRDLAFPFTGLDGKPHIDMLEDTFSDIWYKTNYDGVYHYDAQAETWELANNDSGALTLGADGTLYLSYEVTKHTQISTFFRYVRETKGWEQLHATRGYGIGGVALSPGGHVFMSGGRFGEFVVENTKLWEVQDTYDGQGLSSDESKGVSSKVTSNMASGVVYCVNKFAKQDQEITRIIGLKPALTSKHYYDSDLKMNYSSFLTHGVTEFETAAIKILLEKHLLLATNTVQEAGGTKAGVLQIISIDGQPREIDSLSLEAPVLDMDIDRKNISGHTVIATTKGLLVIKNHDIAALSDPTQSINPAAIERARYPTATELLHSSEHKRVSCCGPNGEIAAILDTTHNITVYHSDLSVQWTKTVSRSFVEDIAIDPDHELVIVVGFDNKKLPSGNPVQVAFVTAWSLTTGNFVMQLFGFDGADLSSNIADTRLYRAVIGPDRFLYIGGESAGTETIFRYDGKNYEGVEKIQKIDFYNDLWNTKSAQITYHARVDLAARTLLRGQLTMARLKSDGTSNTLRLKDGDLCVGSDGSIVLVGSANSQINNRDATRLDGAKVGEYAGAEPSLLWVRPDFRGRNGWSVMVLGDKHKGGTLNACDIWDETLAVSGHIKASSESNDTSMAGYAPTSDSAIIKEPLLSFPTAAEGDGVTTTLQAGWMATVPLRLEPMNITYTDDSDSTSADGDDSESSAVGREVRHGVLVSCLLLVAAATRFVVRA
uniref:Uncharacterized protein n=1 Tax=Vitrella brassicaformis TaxID=1169539 RepID=A0A7S1P941_9ALVE